MAACALGACPDESDSAPVWTRTPGGGAAFSPALDDQGRVLIGWREAGQGGVLAFDGEGLIRRTLPVGGQPVVAFDATLYATAWPSLWAFDTSDAVAWRAEVEGTPAVAGDGTVYTITASDAEKTAGTATLTAVAAHGAVLWSVALPSPPSASPTVGADGTVYAAMAVDGGTGLLQAYNREGGLRWSLGDVVQTPTSLAADEDGHLYLGTAQGLVGVSEAGAVDWFFDAPGAGEPVIGTDGHLVVGTTGGLASCERDGTPRWSAGARRPVSGLAAGDDGRFYFVGERPGVQSGDRRLVAVDGGGDVVREYDPPSWDATVGAPQVGAGRVYVVGESGDDVVLHAYATGATGLADTPWPRTGGAGGQSRSARSAPRAVDAEDVVGIWAADVGAEHHVLEIRLDGTLTLYAYPLGEPAPEGTSGVWTLTGDTLAVTPSGGAEVACTVYPSTAWALDVTDPIDPVRRTFRRVSRPPGPLPPEASWGRTLRSFADGMVADNGPEQVVVMPDGDLLVVGRVGGDSSYDEQPYSPAGTEEWWMGRVGEAGWTWLRYWANPQDADVVRDVALRDGVLVLAGRVTKDDAGGVADLVTFSTDGDPRWLLEVPSPSGEPRQPLALAIAPGGDLVVAGVLGDDSKAALLSETADAFVTRLDVAIDGSGYEVVWDRVFAGPGAQFARDVAVSDSRVVAGGTFEGDVEFVPGQVLTAQGATEGAPAARTTHDLFVVSLDAADGSPQWARRYGPMQHVVDEPPLQLGVDALGAITVAGGFRADLNFGLGVLAPDTAAGDQDVFVVQLSGDDGAPLWDLGLGTPYVVERFGGLAVDPTTGNIVVAGALGNDYTVGGAPLSTNGVGYLALELDRCGDLLWAHSHYDGELVPTAVGRSSAGEVAIVGRGDGGRIDLGDATLDWTNTGAGKAGAPAQGLFGSLMVGAGHTNLPPSGDLPACGASQP